MSKRGRAAVAPAAGKEFVVEDIDIDEPRSNEVLVSMEACGVCHTDVIARDGWRQMPFPLILGHEGAGRVEAVGGAVKRVRPGDRVVLTYPSCGGCESCLVGFPSNCPHMNDLAFRCARADGTSPFSSAGNVIWGPFIGQSSFASHTVVDERSVVRVDTSLPAALLAPLACGVSTGAGAILNTLQPPPGSEVAIFGLGTVGLSAVMAAALVGCTCIIAVDPHEGRRDLAQELGATAVIDPRDGEPAQTIRELTGGGVTFSVESAGVPAVLRQAVHSLATGGTCALVGNHPEDGELAVQITFLDYNRGIRGCVMGNTVPDVFFPMLLRFHEKGVFPYERLVSTYPLTEINRAVEDSLAGVVVKPVLTLS